MKSAAEVSGDLRSLAKQPSFEHHADSLSRLADDIDTDDAALWAKVDLFSVFDENAVVVDADRPSTGRSSPQQLLRRATGSSSLELLRNVLLVLPVGITWVGIFWAVRAYRRLLEAPVDEQGGLADASFLEMWTQGFGGRTRVTFDWVAVLDALVIALVIVVSLAAAWRRRTDDTRDEHERQQYVDELRAVLTDATLVLASVGYEAPDRFSVNLTELASTYRDTLKQLVEAQEALAESVTKGSKNVAEMTTASGDLATSSQVIATSAAGLQQQVTAFGAEVTTLGTEVRDLEVKVSSLVGGATTLGAQVHPVHQELGNLVGEMRQVNRDQGVIAQTLSATADNPRAASRAAADTAKALSETVGALPEQMQQWGKELIEAVDRELSDRRAAAGAMATAGQAATEATQSVERATTALTQEVTQAAMELTQAVRQTTSEMAQSAQQTTRELVRAVDTLTGALQAGGLVEVPRRSRWPWRPRPRGPR